jgi:hypothetical protein
MMSACGVMCSECPAFIAREKGIAYQRLTAAAWERIYGLREPAEQIVCSGCLGADKDVFRTCRKCKARLCCLSNGFSSCAECSETSCAELEKAQSGWDDVPNLKKTLSSADFKTYVQPYCGHRTRLAAVRNLHRKAPQAKV